MALTFFEHPILNSPNAYPGRHWELGADEQPHAAEWAGNWAELPA